MHTRIAAVTILHVQKPETVTQSIEKSDGGSSKDAKANATGFIFESTGKNSF
jgi:hypothetical protein